MATPTIRTLLPSLLIVASPALQAEEKTPAASPPAATVGDLFEERSVLTPRGSLIIEPSLQYTHSTTTQVAIEGYTVIPAVVIGLINLSQVQRDTLTSTLAFRYGLTKRMEVELRLPFVYREESAREREILDGSPTDIIRDSTGSGIGDIEAAVRYQLNGRGGGPYWVVGLRVKSRTGEDPFEVDRETITVEDDQGNPVEVGEIFTEQPTGSGFWSVQPSLSWIYPSDPAVFYGSVSYLWNIERDVRGFGDIDPGDALGFNFGLGFAINERTSVSLGYDHSIVLETEREGDSGLEASFDRFQVGTFLLGMTQRLSRSSSLSVTLGMGVTEFAPDVQLTLRLPISI